MSAKQRFGHLVSDQLTVEQGLSAVAGLTVEGASVWSMLDDGAKVFYCDPANGAAGNVGSREAPVDTMAAALALCTSGRNDVIIRFPGGESVTETCTFNVAGVTVIACTAGLNQLAKGEYFSMYAADTFTDGPVVTITERCTISGMAFVSRDAGTLYYAGAAMLIGVPGAIGPFGVHIHACRVPKWNLTNRMGIGVEGTSDLLIEECSFEGVGADFATGIYVQGACQNPVVRNCLFRDCTVAITHGEFADGVGPEAVYIGNVVQGGGELFNSASKDAAALISGNYLQTAAGTSSFDVNYATLAGLGVYCSGNHYVETD